MYNVNFSTQNRLKIHSNGCKFNESSEVQWLLFHAFREYEIMCIWRLIDDYESRDTWSLYNILFEIDTLNCFDKDEIFQDQQALTLIRNEIESIRHKEIGHADGERTKKRTKVKNGRVTIDMERIFDPV